SAATLGKPENKVATLKGLRNRSKKSPFCGSRRNPYRVATLFCGLPKVAADGNPGLDDATPTGLALKTHHSRLSTQDSGLSTQHFTRSLRAIPQASCGSFGSTSAQCRRAAQRDIRYETRAAARAPSRC